MIVALYSIGPMLLAVAIGRLADRTAPRTPMVISALLMTAVLIVPPVFGGMWALYVAAFGLGLFHQSFSIPLEAVIGGIDGAENRARNYAMISMGWSAANFGGPVIAGVAIDYLGYAQAFWLLAAISLTPVMVLLPASRWLPRAAARKDKHAQHGSIWDLWKQPSLRITIITGTVIGSAKDLFGFYMPVYGHTIGLSHRQIGTIIGMQAAASVLIRAFIPWLMKRMTEVQVLTSALFLSTVALR
jgi:MFS family permease